MRRLTRCLGFFAMFAAATGTYLAFAGNEAARAQISRTHASWFLMRRAAPPISLRD